MCGPMPRISPRALPVVLFKGRQYFADLRLNEFRPVGAFESIPFASKKGRIMCSSTGIVTCKSCGMSVLISMAYEEEPLRCMQCFSSIELSFSEKETSLRHILVEVQFFYLAVRGRFLDL